MTTNRPTAEDITQAQAELDRLRLNHPDAPMMADTNLAPITAGVGAAIASMVTATRNNTQLDLENSTHFMGRECGQQVQGWADVCTPVTNPDHKCKSACYVPHEFRPWTIFSLEECGPLGEINLQNAANQLVEDGTAWALSRELQSAPWTGNPSLQSAAVDLTPPDGAMHAIDGMAMLLQALAIRGQGAGVFHAAMAILPSLTNDSLAQYVNGQVRGPGNLPINPGPGLTGVGPDSTGNIDNDWEGYIYVTTRQVEWNVGPVFAYGPNGEMMTDFTNTRRAEAMRRAAIRFDPGCVFAVRVCLRHETCCEKV